jgi:type III secretion protein J
MNLFDCLRRVRFTFLLCLTLALAACGGQVTLMATIGENDANEMVGVLSSAGINATKLAGKEGMVGLQVPQGDAARAIDTLRGLGLPRENFTGMGQVFQKSGLISSPLEERARYLYALSQDLSATLTRIDGVVFARVHLVLPEKGSALEKDSPSSAAVFIKHRPDHDLESLQPQVRRMVTNSIPGLTGDRVSIVLIPSSAGASGAAPTKLPVLKTVWGIPVAAESAGALGALLWGMLLLLLLVMGGSAALAWRQWGQALRSAVPKLPEAGA